MIQIARANVETLLLTAMTAFSFAIRVTVIKFFNRIESRLEPRSNNKSKLFMEDFK